MQEPLQYINRRGKSVEVRISEHAKDRFLQRWPRVFPDNPLTRDTVDAVIAKFFNQSKRLKKLSYHDRKRLAKHGKDTLYFRSSEFTFIIQDAKIITVEVSLRDGRHLNKSDDFLELIVSDPSKTIKKPTAATKPKPPPKPKKLPKFRLIAAANDPNGSLCHVNLGSYDSVKFNGCAEKLRGNRAFCDEMRRRFREKKPLWTMLLVFASLGKKGGKIKVIDELH